MESSMVCAACSFEQHRERGTSVSHVTSVWGHSDTGPRCHSRCPMLDRHILFDIGYSNIQFSSLTNPLASKLAEYYRRCRAPTHNVQYCITYCLYLSRTNHVDVLLSCLVATRGLITYYKTKY